jgi:two-component system OmpR family response regulator
MKKILILYDNASVRELLTEALAGDGHLVVPVSKVALAKEVIGSLKPDLLLLNLHIDGKDRWDVLKEIKRQYPYLRVLVLSTCAVCQEDLSRVSADVFLIKSFRFEGLRQKVAEVLQRKLIPADGILRSEDLQTLDNNINFLRPGF